MTPDILPIDRAAAGLNEAGVARLSAGMRNLVESGYVAGVLCMIFRDGHLGLVDIHGWQDREAAIPLARDTIFRIASMTKPIISAAALSLLEEGRLLLSDPIDDLAPELAGLRVLTHPLAALDDTTPAPRPITYLDLLTHRSGLAYDFTAAGPLSAAITEAIGAGPFPAIAPDAWMRRLGSLPLIAAPGTRWHYGVSTDVLGVLIERMTGQTLESALRTRIFEPLGMTDTGFHVPAGSLGRLAVAYTPGGEGLRIWDHPSSSPWAHPPIFASGGAGLVSTADDYLRFARMLLGEGTLDGARVLSRHSVALMRANLLTLEQREPPSFMRDILTGRGFGLGLSVVDDLARQDSLGSVGRFGWPGAFCTAWTADPQERLVALMFPQLRGDERRTIRAIFDDLVYQAL
jgi:CubicO group peptidase (beta-lactamase class C family)